MYNASYARFGIAQAKLSRGDLAAALAELAAALREFRAVGADIGIALALDYFALIAIQSGRRPPGRPSRSLRRSAAAGGRRRDVYRHREHEPPLEQARRLLDDVAFNDAVGQGEADDLDQAERVALAVGQTR